MLILVQQFLSDVDGNPINKALYLPNQSLQPYMLESNLQFKLSESVTNNIAACNLSQGNLYFWHPQTIQNNPMNNESSSYLMCSWWNPPPAMTPSGGGSGGAINGAYGYLMGNQMFWDSNGNYNGYTPDPSVQASISMPSQSGIILNTQVNGNGNGVPMTLTAGDVSGVPEYGSNNMLMTAANDSLDITYNQTVFIGETYNNTDVSLSFNGTPQPNGVSAGFIFNLVHPLSEGLNLPIALAFYGKNNNFFLAPACAFTVPVLVNSVNGMVPICDNSVNVPISSSVDTTWNYYSGPDYYGNNYLIYIFSSFVNHSYPYPYSGWINDNVFIPAVTLFNSRRSISVIGEMFDSNMGVLPTFTMNFQ